MSGKTGDDQGPRHARAGIGQAAARIPLTVAEWRGEGGERSGRPR
jgi:hypothetical protein